MNPAGTPAKATPKPTQEQEIAELRETVTSMQTRINTLESRLSGARPEAVYPSPTHGVGDNVNALTAAHDPEAGFVNDEAVQTYRKAMILLQAGKLNEAALTFSSFVERFPDHPLAGSAQFFLGESYFRQHDYSTALKEFSRVPTSYDRSSHVSHALARMAQSEDMLKKPQEAAKHRELLASLFPQSPATSLDASGAGASRPVQADLEQAPADGGESGRGAGFDPPPTAPVGGSRVAPRAPSQAVQETQLAPSSQQLDDIPAQNTGAPADE